MIAPAPAHAFEVRGRAALLDGELVDLVAGPLSVLRALARAEGRRTPRRACGLPGGDAHAVETTVSRLRVALGDPTLLLTVVRRGYRLATDPA